MIEAVSTALAGRDRQRIGEGSIPVVEKSLGRGKTTGPDPRTCCVRMTAPATSKKLDTSASGVDEYILRRRHPPEPLVDVLELWNDESRHIRDLNLYPTLVHPECGTDIRSLSNTVDQ